MADNLKYTEGEVTDPDVATDDVGGVHFQKFKLDVGGNGTSTPVEGTVPVSGTVTVSEPVTVDGTVDVGNFPATQAISHAALTELGAAIDTELQVDVVGSLPAGTNNIGDVDVVSSTLPTGASTSEKQDTIIGHVDGLEGLLTTIDADTGTLAGALGSAFVDGNGSLAVVPVTDGGSPLRTTDDAASAYSRTLMVATGSIGAWSDGRSNGEIIATGTEGALTGEPAVAPMVYNGTTWDRLRGDTLGIHVSRQATSATATFTNVNDTASSTTLLAANTSRKGATIHNDSTAILYVKFGTTASTTSYTVKMVADAYYEVPFGYTGRIDGIWASDASGAARITEMT